MSEFQTDKTLVKNTDVDALYSQLLEKIKKVHQSENEINIINKAFEVAKKQHGGQLRRSGEPYIIHPIAVADILVNFGMDYQSLVAALLHDVVEDTDYTLDELKAEFGGEVAVLVDGVTKLGHLQLSEKDSREEQQAENISKMLLAMSKDIRVIVIKLADRLHNMRTLEYVAPQKQRDKALETLEIFAPISHRLGIRSVKEELEDRAIRFLDPVAYAGIEEQLHNFNASGNEFLNNIKNRILERVRETVPNATISGRIKSVHGIYRKMYMQNKQFSEIYDIYAVRIIVDTIGDCYNCLGIIHDMFSPLPGRFKDYISTPKPNRYQSLHTTVIGKDAIPFEVQIRTWEMHRTAELGIAAHWKYKVGMTSGGKESFNDGLDWIKEMLEVQEESGDAREIVSSIKTDLVPEEVFVFTPKGDVINVPQGSTIIDFAYSIHTAVGHKMMGAKVDGRIVPLDYVVKTGEIVEILTSSQPGKGPSRDWLNIAKSSKAKSRIRSWFKNEKRDENIAEGKAEIEREFKRNYIRLTDEEYETFIKKLAARQHLDSVEDFYAAIGYGGLSVSKQMPYIKDEYHKNYDKSHIEEISAKQPAKRKSKDGIIVDGIDNCLIKFSRCCNPLPGDKVIGFITRGHGVSVHKADCVNVPADIARCAEPERWVKVHWDTATSDKYSATITVTCLKRMGLIADVSQQIANMKVNIVGLTTHDTKDGRCIIEVTVQVEGIEHLKSLASKIEKVQGVISVER